MLVRAYFSMEAVDPPVYQDRRSLNAKVLMVCQVGQAEP